MTEQDPETALAVPQADPGAARWKLLRDLVVLQAKLLLDGLKDIVLSPIAIVLAIYGLVFEPKRPGRAFYELLQTGRSFDRWVDLYGADEHASLDAPPAGLDVHLRKLEALVLAQHAKGGMTRQAKEAIDQAIDALQREQPSAPEPPQGEPRD